MLTRSLDDHEAGAASASIRAAGLMVTLPRLAVWMALEQSDTPLLVTDLYRCVMTMGASVSVSAVYGALKRFTEAGVVAAHAFDDGKAHYVLASRRCRHRIVCEDSGEEHWVAGPGLHRVIAEFCQTHGFNLSDYTLSIRVVQAKQELENKESRRRDQNISRTEVSD